MNASRSGARAWDPSAVALVRLLTTMARGPKRDGVFALWLTLRVAQDLLIDPPIAERAHRRRVAALERRFSSLALPPPLRRALTAAVVQLRESRPEAAVMALHQLAAPARDTLGGEAGEAIVQAARAARGMMP